MEENKIRQHVLEDKYTEWQRIVIEPQSMNDARLYSIECRVNEEEEMRIKEYEYMRDLIKKLVYALEQQVMVNYDRHKDVEDESKALPNLMGA